MQSLVIHSQITHPSRLPELQRHEYLGVQRTWQGRDRGEERQALEKLMVMVLHDGAWDGNGKLEAGPASIFPSLREGDMSEGQF